MLWTTSSCAVAAVSTWTWYFSGVLKDIFVSSGTVIHHRQEVWRWSGQEPQNRTRLSLYVSWCLQGSTADVRNALLCPTAPHATFYSAVIIAENNGVLWMLDASPGLYFPVRPWTQHPAAPYKVPHAILFWLSKSLFFCFLWEQHSQLSAIECNAVIAELRTVWIKLSVLKMEVLGLVSDSEHFHFCLCRMFALCSGVSESTDQHRRARLPGKLLHSSMQTNVSRAEEEFINKTAARRVHPDAPEWQLTHRHDCCFYLLHI